MNKPTLWVMVGLSGSGKSSMAKEIAENKIQLQKNLKNVGRKDLENINIRCF